jgi:hypothetical protein
VQVLRQPATTASWSGGISVRPVYSQTEQDIFYVNGNRTQTGVNALDGRPKYSKVSTAFGDLPTLTNTSEGEDLLASIVISRPTRSGFGFSGGYTYMDSENAFDGTSSRAISNWQFTPRATSSTTRSRVELGERNRLDQPELQLPDSPSSTPSARSQRRVAGHIRCWWRGDRTIDANSDGHDNDLLYVPGSPDEVIFRIHLGAVQSTPPNVAKHRRPQRRSPWRRLDFHYGIEVPIFRVRTQFTVDLINALNLIDEDEGVVKYVNFGTPTPIRTSVDATGKTVYTQNFPNAIANPQSAVTSDISRWNVGWASV